MLWGISSYSLSLGIPSGIVSHGGNVRLERQVQRWLEAGIIDAATAERIIAHERRASRPVLLLALGGLGAFTIGVGLISVVAANWGDIPRLVKLLAMLGLFGANAYGLVWARSRPYRWVTDALALAYFALTLASIALVGQTYQLGGEPYQALLLWLVVGSPALWLAEGAFAALVFLGALAVTAAFSFDPLVDLLGHDHHATILVRASLGSAAVFGPLLVSQPADPCSAGAPPLLPCMSGSAGACSCWQRAAACTCGICPWTPTTYVRRG